MKVVLLGRGHRLIEIANSYIRKRIPVTAVTDLGTTYDSLGTVRKIKRFLANPEETTLQDLGIELDPKDIVVVSIYEENPLRRTLDHLIRRQNIANSIMVYTPLETRGQEKEFPQVHFHKDTAVYTTSLTEIIRKSSSQQKMDQLRALVRDAGRAVILIWGNPDPDALASAFALKHLLRKDSEKIVIAYTGEFTRAENLEMVHALDIPVEKYRADHLQDNTAVITVDAQPSFFENDGITRFDAVIDHHPRANGGPVAFSDIRPTYGSTSTILAEYFLDLGEKIPKKIATALLYGLKVDTNNLQRNFSDADVNAFKVLRKLTDENVIRRIELSQMPVDTLDHFGIALMKKKVAKPVIFAYLGKIDNPDACVHIADFYLKVEGISMSIVSSRDENKLIVIFRSDGFRNHAGKLAESLFGTLGTAGGHRVMARAEMELFTLSSELADLNDKTVEEWLIRKFAAKLRAMKKLL